MNDWLKQVEEFRTVFTRAAQERSKRPGLVDDPVGPWPGRELAWVPYEREQMLEAVNVVRLTKGLPLATLSSWR